MTDTEKLNRLKAKVLAGDSLTDTEAYSLLDITDKDALYSAAEEITAALCSRDFDSCSIANVRSGHCSENCRWCAQSAHFNTGCNNYEILDRDTCMAMARANADNGVKRFSLVASGRAVKGETLKEICSMLRDIKAETGIFTCASLGLLDEDSLRQLWDAGVRRYHCNLETAPSFFPSLCTTHTIEDKLATIEKALKLGFEICSGGIIGMGESPRQRVELALTLRRARPKSIPVNILCPIPGTPLENAAPLSDDEILTSLSIFRFVHPTLQIRFAGGRARLSRDTQIRAMRIAVNGGIVGDLLTTIGSKVKEDRQLTKDAGYRF